MKVRTSNWQQAGGIYQALWQAEEAAKKNSGAVKSSEPQPEAAIPAKMETEETEAEAVTETEKAADAENLLKTLKEMAQPASGSAGSGSKPFLKSSTPEDSVGQLAALLARAESKMDVQQVSSKAMRALSNLKMASAFSEGTEKQKIQQMIRRMNKLIKRIHKKLNQLGKEEQLEQRRQLAEKQMQEDKEKELGDELRSRRTRRRREEQNYARKEQAEDRKEELKEFFSNMPGMASSSLSSGVSAQTTGASESDAAAFADASVSSGAADFSGAGSISLDVVV